MPNDRAGPEIWQARIPHNSESRGAGGGVDQAPRTWTAGRQWLPVRPWTRSNEPGPRSEQARQAHTLGRGGGGVGTPQALAAKVWAKRPKWTPLHPWLTS